jgi:putative phosphoribosyl transferase
MFRDRNDAAEQLAKALSAYRGRNALVLGIPRGSVPMARLIADRLGGEADVVLVRKLRAPGNPEYAIGSIDESGWTFIGDAMAAAEAGETYLEAEKARQFQALRERRAAYSAKHGAVDPGGRVVIVIDDGLATGSTMIAALHSLRARNPEKLVCAVPVAPPETVERIRAHCDEMICLHAPIGFYAVGQFYRAFPQVDDSEVIKVLSLPTSA